MNRKALAQTAIKIAPLALLLMTVTLIGDARSAAGAGFLVNTNGDASDAQLNDNVCDTNLGTAGLQCSLRAAIQQANALAGRDTITFDASVFPSGSPATIHPASGMPASTDAAGIGIDGTGAGVILDGTGLVGDVSGLVIATSPGVNLADVKVRFMTVQNFPAHGVTVCGGLYDDCLSELSDTLIEDVRALDNGENGIDVHGAPNLRTAVSGGAANDNGDSGININGRTNSFLMDATVDGAEANGNGSSGITLNSADNNIRSTITDASTNDNTGRGIHINAGDDIIETRVDDSDSNGNGNTGININAGKKVIDASVTDSTVTGNPTGININAGDATGNSGGLIDGNSASGNTGDGLRLDIPGTVSNNTASGNIDGIAIVPSGVTIAGNNITNNSGHAIDGSNQGGHTITGNTITGNTGTSSAVRIPGLNNVVNDNVIQNNAGDGVDNNFSGGGALTALRNTVTDNGGDGIAGGPEGNSEVRDNVAVDNLVGIRANGIGNTVTGNDVRNNTQEGFRTSGATNDVHFNRIVGNGTGMDAPNGVNAENNWWGCNEGPGAAGCDTVVDTPDFDPWLVLTLTADPTPVMNSQNNLLRASLNLNSDGLDPAGTIPNLAQVTFAADQGNLQSPRVIPLIGGLASTLLIPDILGPIEITASYDNETVTLATEVITFATTTATPTPTPSGSPVTGTPTPSPSPTGSPDLIQGDVTCDGDVSPADAGAVLAYAGELQPEQEPDCPEIGSEVASLFGDVNCDGAVNALDALHILAHEAGFALAQDEPCPNIGTSLG